MRPVIGITTPNQKFNSAYLSIKLAVWLCGGRPVPLKRMQTLDDLHIDGLLVGGGTDVFPQLFKGQPKANYTYDHKRDELEIAWLKRAENDGIPVLAICRGAQMMNVMNGGELHMNVSESYEDAVYPKGLMRYLFFRRWINISEHSLLRRVMGAQRVRVNSMHSQSISNLGRNLKIVAQEDNGVVQAIERPDHPFYIGVQFHPEFMIYRSYMWRLFRDFIKAAMQ
tara:strand:+ start:304 stop:978 length:675 start_codon:yes stop_codon:yes gene_type:complete